MPTPTLFPLPSLVSPQQIAPAATREVPPGFGATPASSTATTSGLRLIAKLGSTCPGPQRPGQVCAGPYAGEFIITTDMGAEVARATTDQEGRATVDLPPGRYTVTPNIQGRLPTGAPVDVTVPPGQVVDVNMELDSGMR